MFERALLEGAMAPPAGGKQSGGRGGAQGRSRSFGGGSRNSAAKGLTVKMKLPPPLPRDGDQNKDKENKQTKQKSSKVESDRQDKFNKGRKFSDGDEEPLLPTTSCRTQQPLNASGGAAGRGQGHRDKAMPVPGSLATDSVPHTRSPSATAAAFQNAGTDPAVNDDDDNDMDHSGDIYKEQRNRKRLRRNRSALEGKSRDSSYESPGKTSRLAAVPAPGIAVAARYDALLSVGSEVEVGDSGGDDTAGHQRVQECLPPPSANRHDQSTAEEGELEESRIDVASDSLHAPHAPHAPRALDQDLVSNVVGNVLSQVKDQISNLSDVDVSMCNKYLGMIGTVFNQCSPILDAAVSKAIATSVAPLAKKVSANAAGVAECQAKIDSLSESVEHDVKPALDSVTAACNNNSDIGSLGLIRGELNRQEMLDKSVKIYGVPQSGDEKCRNDTLNVALSIFGKLRLEGGVKISKEAISDVYRIPSRRQGSHPPIRIDFCRIIDRKVVMGAKAQLKGMPDSNGISWKKVRIEECLTFSRSVVFRKLMEHHKVGYVSTRNGEMVVRLKQLDTNGVPIDGPFQQPRYFRRLDRITELGIFTDDEAESIMGVAFDLPASQQPDA